MKNSYCTKNINSINIASGCKGKLISESNIYSSKDPVFLLQLGHRPFIFIIFSVYLYLFVTLLLIRSLTTGSDTFIFKLLRCSLQTQLYEKLAYTSRAGFSSRSGPFSTPEFLSAHDQRREPSSLAHSANLG